MLPLLLLLLWVDATSATVDAPGAIVGPSQNLSLIREEVTLELKCDHLPKIITELHSLTDSIDKL